jgi:hypothetical protein
MDFVSDTLTLAVRDYIGKTGRIPEGTRYAYIFEFKMMFFVLRCDGRDDAGCKTDRSVCDERCEGPPELQALRLARYLQWRSMLIKSIKPTYYEVCGVL